MEVNGDAGPASLCHLQMVPAFIPLQVAGAFEWDPFQRF